MFPRPKYHARKRWTGQHGSEIRALAGALARLLEEENVQSQWRGVPPRSFQRAPHPRQMRPYYYTNHWPERPWPQRPPRAYPPDPRAQVLPRKGPPVAFMRVPRRYQHDKWETRQPRGSNPGGPLRGGPERSADDPWRKPRGGLCGGPGRSAKEPQAPSQTSLVKTNGENKERKRKTKGPKSSQWTRAGKNESGGRSPEPLHGEWAHSGMA